MPEWPRRGGVRCQEWGPAPPRLSGGGRQAQAGRAAEGEWGESGRQLYCPCCLSCRGSTQTCSRPELQMPFRQNAAPLTRNATWDSNATRRQKEHSGSRVGPVCCSLAVAGISVALHRGSQASQESARIRSGTTGDTQERRECRAAAAAAAPSLLASAALLEAQLQLHALPHVVESL